MYSNVKSVRILVSLLKEYNIKNVVLSLGGSAIPLIYSLEHDDFFNCYSVVDERNATYFAMGMAQELNEPVACICTSGTSICNYLPGITEAFYQNVPVIAITADKNPYFQGQLETQKIDQMHTFENVVKKSVNLPLVNNADDEWLCNRLINEALLELNHHGTGPVHINIPIVGITTIFDEENLPKERVIRRYENLDDEKVCMGIANELSKKKKIMVIVGQNLRFSKEEKEILSKFFNKFNCFFATEHLSNLQCDGAINTYPITEMSGLNNKLIPDLVISIGNNLSAYSLKPFLRNNYKNIENWFIDLSGRVRDTYKSLTKVFECSPMKFFEKMVDIESEDFVNDKKYYNEWKTINDLVKMPEFSFSNYYIAEKMSKIVPKYSILHLAILSSTRTMQFFELDDSIYIYSNVGALGIDGCLATFAGQAASTDKKAYLIIGDLSFFYGMNGAALKSIGKNVRIILVNNTGGGEFHHVVNKNKVPTLNKYITAQHDYKAGGWISSLGYDYYSANSKEEFDKIAPILSEDSDKPIFLEVFTNMENDADEQKNLYKMNALSFSVNEGGTSGFKKMVKNSLSEKQKDKIKDVIKRFKKK